MSKNKVNGDKCIVVLSGGQDSTTALAWAKQTFGEVHAITFDYGQRHETEIDSARKVAEMLGVDSHEIIALGPILKGTSPLVNKESEVGHYDSVNSLPGGIEPTFVPGRNALFLTIAANRAAAVGAVNIVTGICQADYGGYPDCRADFLGQMGNALSFALTGKLDQLLFHHPLLDHTKKDSVLMAAAIPGCMEALAYSHTCYDGDYPPNPSNHASLLRARGFSEAGIGDPLIMRAKKEGKLPDDYPDSGLIEGTKFAGQKTDPPPVEKSAKKAKKHD